MNVLWILFDGSCSFCLQNILFIAKYDSKNCFRFVPLQSEAGHHLLKKYGLPSSYRQSLVLIRENMFYLKSDAALRIVAKLKFPLPMLFIFIFVPKMLRDTIYDMIAANRHHICSIEPQPVPEIVQKRLVTNTISGLNDPSDVLK